jgi:hypothetical protein
MSGVDTERFQVWMRVAALPKFRKLYAVLSSDLAEGDVVTFTVEANFDVSHFKGTRRAYQFKSFAVTSLCTRSLSLARAFLLCNPGFPAGFFLKNKPHWFPPLGFACGPPGTKSLILTTTSWFGGKNTFIGAVFVAVGAICVGFGVLFVAKQAAAPRVLGDLKFLK